MIFGKHINKYYVKYFPMILLGVLSLLMVDFFQLKIPELYRMVINGISNGFVEIDGQAYTFNMEFVLDEICLPLLVVILALIIGRFLWRICFFGSAIKVETSLRAEMFDHCKDLSQQYYQKNKVGNLMSLFTNDIETINECFGDGLLMLFDAILLGGLAILKMARMNWFLTLLTLIPMALLLIIGTVIGKYMMKKWEMRQEAFSALSDFSQENFSGIAVVKAFVKEGKELWAFRKLNKDNEKANIEFTRSSVLLHSSVTLFVESVICVILGYGGYLVYKGAFNAGELIEFMSYFTSTVWPVMAVSSLIEMSSRGKASLKRIGELLDAPINVHDREDVHDIDNIRGDIEFKDLTFRYPDADYDALEDVSFKINAGENVGIIGKTGSGKTTMVDLILRTYNVPDGMLYIDGHDVNSIPIKTVRKYSAYVPQDNFLFSDTIENNIAFASDSFERDDVVTAAKLSDVHDNISEFSENYLTVLGERGVTVSGGQKQRISIARALMKDASILILDDSVSAVDTKTEEVIISNLRENRRGKTTILIAHRISTVEKMDKIIFVDDGKIKAVGKHEDLVENCPEYKIMVELQKLEEEKEGK
ncbi:MAG: ABC transporter ATP-binding protein [Ruminococcaceae bacterium]|nr:ABC transporter ATP-binding protein [Oscillospiraceae bacterium]